MSSRSPCRLLPPLLLATTLAFAPALAAALPSDFGPSVPAGHSESFLSLLGDFLSSLWAADSAANGTSTEPDAGGGTNNSDTGMLIDPHG
ncbi:MAG TPA: hypothetical protein VEW48_19105 [Thermoanaerobaculia bacterium]|nr:hypothetical protein [Thermoanaerobaculia bacterium]